MRLQLRPTAAALCAALFACALAQPAPPPAASPEADAPRGPVQWQLEWARGAVFYQLLVRSYADSDGDGNGDLKGLISKLDYLNDGRGASGTSLGVDALWLLPVFDSPSYHGYDTRDFDAINPIYGTTADFELLCAEAHKRGIRVIVDLVLNHTSNEHPWFRESASSPASPKRDWYVWRDADPGWTQPWSRNPTWYKKNGAWYYGLFWHGMPDLNFRTPAVRAEAKRIAKQWLDRGVDGFRLDAAKHMIEGPKGEQQDTPETHAFWREFSAYVRSVRRDALLVGEVWSAPDLVAPYYGDTSVVKGGDELPMTFDFHIGGAIINAVKTGKAVAVFSALRELQKAYPRGVLDAPFLTNHDQTRVATELEGDVRKLGAAAAVLLTLPGAPFVYYGEELGLRNYGHGFGLKNGPMQDDEFKRTPMPWDASPGGGFTTGKPWQRFSGERETINVAAEQADPRSLLARYRGLIAARHASPALRKGELELLPPQGSALAFVRRAESEAALVVHNLGAAPLAVGPLKVEAGALVPVFADPGVGAPASGPEGWTVEVPAYASAVWRIQGVAANP